MATVRSGYEQQVGRFRALAVAADPDRDPAPMVQELVARLRFTKELISLDGKTIVDHGCGTGLGLQWLRLHTHAARLVGVDVSEGAIAFARAHYPGNEFAVMNIEGPNPEFQQAFDIALSFEVLEPLREPDAALRSLVAGYLKPTGMLVATTPNRLVFSAGMEPSPINRTHIHEMDADEFRQLLERHFYRVSLWGMRFRDPANQRAHQRMVRHSCSGYRMLGEWWWNPHLSRLYRWLLCGEVFRLMFGRQRRRWSADEFEFVQEPLETAIWFYALCEQPRETPLA